MTQLTNTPALLRIRIPAVAVGIALALVGLAFILDQGTSGQRDAALLVGTIAGYMLLPLAAAWLVVAVVLRLRRRP